MKKLLSVLLAALLILSCAACAADPATPANSDPAAAQTSTPEAPASEGKRDVVLGMNTYLTGEFAELGQAQKQGAEIAIKHINEAGGVNGHMLKLIAYDDKASTENDVQNIMRLIEEDHVDAICNCCLSAAVLATYEMTAEAKVIQVASTPSDLLTNLSPWVFRPIATYTVMNTQNVKNMGDMGYKTIGVMYANTETGLTSFEFMRDMLEQDYGATVLGEVYNYGDTDYSSQFSKMINNGAETIFLFMNTQELGLAFQQVRRLGFDGLLFGSESCCAPVVREVGGDAANDVIYTTVNVIPDSIDDASTDLERKFLTDYVAAYGELPRSDLAYRGYDQVLVLAEAFRNVDNIDDKDALRDSMQAVSGVTGLQGTYDFTDGTGDGLSVSKVWAISGGKNVLLEDYLAKKA